MGHQVRPPQLLNDGRVLAAICSQDRHGAAFACAVARVETLPLHLTIALQVCSLCETTQPLILHAFHTSPRA